MIPLGRGDPRTTPSTGLDYRRRVELAIAYAAAHLVGPLDLGTMAATACFSPWHFHRIYRYLTGETVNGTVRRLRLHRAAGELVQGAAPIADIARRAGYGSAAAFGRAFRADYGIPPATYRQQGRLIPPVPGTTIDEESRMYDVEIRTQEPVRLAAMRHAGPYMQIGSAFDRLASWAAGRGLMTPTTRAFRSDERRVGKECGITCRSRWSRDH